MSNNLSSASPFRQTAAPISFVSNDFISDLAKNFSLYLETRETIAEKLATIKAWALNGRVNDEAFKKETHNMYVMFMLDACMNAAFLGYCLKNIDIMEPAAARIQAQHDSKMWLTIGMCAERRQIVEEMGFLREQIAQGIAPVYQLLTGKWVEAHHFKYPMGDPLAQHFLNGTHFGLQDFNDWIEFSFLQRYSIPLGVLDVSPVAERLMQKEISSKFFRNRFRNLQQTRQFQRLFPAMQLDGGGRTPAKLAGALFELMNDASFPPYAYTERHNVVSFTHRLGQRQTGALADSPSCSPKS